MRKIRIIEIVIPEIIALAGSGADIDDMEPDYRCPKCGMGIAKEYVCCPYCRSEFNWDKVEDPRKERYGRVAIKMVNDLLREKVQMYKQFRSELDSIWIPEFLAEDKTEIVKITDADRNVGIMVIRNNHIDCIYVLPEYRKKGLARKAVMERFRNRPYPTLGILNSNYAAKHFWAGLFEMEVIWSDSIQAKYRVCGYKY